VIQNGWLNIFENFRWCHDFNIKYIVCRIHDHIPDRECPKWIFIIFAEEKTYNAQHPFLSMKYNKYFGIYIIPVSIRVVIIYKKYISVIQNISSKTLEQDLKVRLLLFINKCLK